MSTQIRFNSVLQPNKYGYVFTNDSMTFWDSCYRDNGALHGAMGYFEKLGDGNVQHTPLMVARVNQFTDYCISLAQYLIDNPAEEIAQYSTGLNDPVGEATIRFLATVKYSEANRRWFNLTEHKVSSSDTKRYDKRWTEVPSWANGTMESAYNLFCVVSEISRNAFERYALQSLFWDTLYTQVHGEWDKVTAWQAELSGDHRAAFQALKLVVESRSKIDSAKRVLSCALHNSELNKAA